MIQSQTAVLLLAKQPCLPAPPFDALPLRGSWGSCGSVLPGHAPARQRVNGGAVYLIPARVTLTCSLATVLVHREENSGKVRNKRNTERGALALCL